MQNQGRLNTDLIARIDPLVPSTDLLREEPRKDSYLAPEVELLEYEAIKRVCYTCFDNE